ncbi:hypothetical protein F0L68_24220 [Solihabitans fulvus]|uniref:Syndecan 1 n=1 Tax=Solihabitans fulvus TaxID=1892852 RepID=A0A5B2X4C7_9PSEU|nr:hypothetical protein [Solihabitans fulvus]KAA2258084.1 hypothetical protein F0L68_24220 [Solihabitans fulvus]
MGLWQRLFRRQVQRRPDDAPRPSATAPADGWLRAAPMPRVIQRIPETLGDGDAFRGTLASWRNPSLTGQLGHRFASDAPAGVARGLARPVPSSTADELPLVARATAGEQPPADSTDPLPAAAPAVPGRRIGLPPVRRIPMARARARRAEEPAPAKEITGPVAPLVEPARRSQDEPEARTALVVERAPAAKPASAGTVPSVQRLGVGEPLTSLPPTARLVSPTVESDSPQWTYSGGKPVVQRSVGPDPGDDRGSAVPLLGTAPVIPTGSDQAAAPRPADTGHRASMPDSPVVARRTAVSAPQQAAPQQAAPQQAARQPAPPDVAPRSTPRATESRAVPADDGPAVPRLGEATTGRTSISGAQTQAPGPSDTPTHRATGAPRITPQDAADPVARAMAHVAEAPDPLPMPSAPTSREPAGLESPDAVVQEAPLLGGGSPAPAPPLGNTTAAAANPASPLPRGGTDALALPMVQRAADTPAVPRDEPANRAPQREKPPPTMRSSHQTPSVQRLGVGEPRTSLPPTPPRAVHQQGAPQSQHQTRSTDRAGSAATEVPILGAAPSPADPATRDAPAPPSAVRAPLVQRAPVHPQHHPAPERQRPTLGASPARPASRDLATGTPREPDGPSPARSGTTDAAPKSTVTPGFPAVAQRESPARPVAHRPAPPRSGWRGAAAPVQLARGTAPATKPASGIAPPTDLALHRRTRGGTRPAVPSSTRPDQLVPPAAGSAESHTLLGPISVAVLPQAGAQESRRPALPHRATDRSVPLLATQAPPISTAAGPVTAVQARRSSTAAPGVRVVRPAPPKPADPLPHTEIRRPTPPHAPAATSPQPAVVQRQAAPQRQAADARLLRVAGIPSNIPVTVVQRRTEVSEAEPSTREQAGVDLDGLDIDELARRLFEPMTRMLRAELRHDRARAGRSHERRY